MSRYSSHALHESDEPPQHDVVPLAAYRNKRRHDEIDAFNFTTKHEPGSFELSTTENNQ